MTPQELRIGNLVTDEYYEAFKKVICVESVHAIGINVSPGDDGKPYGMHLGTIDPTHTFEQIRGIPLTADLLEKAGFVKLWHINHHEYVLRLDSFYLEGISTDDRFRICLASDADNTDSTTNSVAHIYFNHVTNVHQLQNLYFALTGKELTITL